MKNDTGDFELPLKFAVICDGDRLQRWQYRCVEDLVSSGTARPVLLLIGPNPKPFTGLFKRVSRVTRGGPAESVVIGGVLQDLPRVELEKARDSGQRITEEATASIRERELDFILSFSGAANGLTSLAAYGVWQFEFGDGQRFRGGPPGFWEVYRNAPVSGAMLVRLTDDPDVIIPLRRGSVRTRQFSYAGNRDQLLTRFTHWPAQVCREVAAGEAAVLNSQPLRLCSPPNAAPGDLRVILFGLRLAWFLLTRGARSWFNHDHWNIGIIDQPIEELLDPGIPRKPVRWLPAPPRGEFVADPFGVVREGRLTVFCEHLDYNGDATGTILTIDPDTRSEMPVSIGPQPRVHLSYPNVFEHEGRMYCIPETGAAHEVALYELQRYPDRWVKACTLIQNVSVADSTVFQHDGRWWLTAASDPGGAHLGTDLCVWYAPELRGPWTPHASNPVKTDVGSARPAGAVFKVNGALYRPAQDSSLTYGQRVVINRLVCLTPQSFLEEPVSYVEPDPRGPYPDGLHTLNGVASITLVDGKRLAFAPREFARMMGRMIRRRLRMRGRH